MTDQPSAAQPARLRVDGVDVAAYVVDPEVDPRHGPRPYLHPVRTLGGVVVTDVAPADHPWHLGVSVAMQDVAGTNLWGGRTYVRGQGYMWRDDHGTIAHVRWLPWAGGFAERLEWRDPAGRPLLIEERRVAAAAAPAGWELSFAYALTPAGADEVTLGSPATNGRPGGAGYGGFFWRVAPGPSEERSEAFTVFTVGADGEEAVNGSGEPWLALIGSSPGGRPYTLAFHGLAGDDRWFVRTGIYPGVCAALAFSRPLVVDAAAVRRRLTVLVADGALTRDRVAEWAAGRPGRPARDHGISGRRPGRSRRP
jgi:hypothetical protein